MIEEKAGGVLERRLWLLCTTIIGIGDTIGAGVFPHSTAPADEEFLPIIVAPVFYVTMLAALMIFGVLQIVAGILNLRG